jgi:hypothetical protein
MSNLVRHAKYELSNAGLFDPDSDYDGQIGVAVMGLIDTIAGQGHSGASIGYTVWLFNRLVAFKPLTPLTDNPNEWLDVADYMDGQAVWQSRRQSDAFSNDGGKTYYTLDDPERTLKETVHGTR